MELLGNNRKKSTKGGDSLNWLSRAALLLVIIGALNWLLVGLFQWDLVTALLGGETMRSASMLSRIVYTLVGLSGIYCLTFLFGDNKVGSE
jgi:uncharacterized membrane protein YuzA (DUF378 family)